MQFFSRLLADWVFADIGVHFIVLFFRLLIHLVYYYQLITTSHLLAHCVKKYKIQKCADKQGQGIIEVDVDEYYIQYMLKKLNPIIGRAFRYKFSTAYDGRKDYYKILGVQKTANDAQVKSAYYKLAMKYHPDHNKGQEAKFKEINQAYSVLSDAKAKKQYEASRAGGTNYNNYNNQYTYEHDPYRNYHRNQTQNQYSQWNYQQYHQQQQQQNNAQWNRQYYENPYESYDRFRQAYEQADRERQKRRQQQYQAYMKQQGRVHEEIANNFRKSVRFAVIASIILLLLIMPRNNHRAHYVDPNSAHYQVVTINGNPYLQKAPPPLYNPQYGQPQGRDSH